MGSDTYRIDSHKLHYHVDRVNEWQRGAPVYPIYVEISPSGACNHRCVFCAMDYVGYKTRFLNTEVLTRTLTQMSCKGVRSVMYAGEGEPLLHRDIAQIIAHTKKVGIDVAITSNAVALTPALSEKILGNVTWLKASVNAGTSETYGKIHRTRPAHFEQVIANLAAAARIRKEKGFACSLGAQMVMLPENWEEGPILAQRAKEAGLDYVVLKPYSQHAHSITRRYEDIQYDGLERLREKVQGLQGEGFKVVLRSHTMQKLSDPDRHYQKCLSTPHFWAHVMSDGSVYGCSAYLLDNRFNYGNIYEKSFEEIWDGPKRKEGIRHVEEMCIEECRKNCRMDEVNRYLWDLTHPGPHVNFI